MAGFYLGDTDTTSQVMWLHSKFHCCHVLCWSGTKMMHNAEPILLHGIFNIIHQPFKLTADANISNKSRPESLKDAYITDAMAQTNVWACLERIQDEELLGWIQRLSAVPQELKHWLMLVTIITH